MTRSQRDYLIDEGRCRRGEQNAVARANGAGIKSYFDVIITPMSKQHRFVNGTLVQ